MGVREPNQRNFRVMFFFFFTNILCFFKYLRIHRKTERPWFIVGLVVA